jgi:uncharacterized protein
MKVTLSLTHKCNLACHYCYAGRAAKPDMTLETARKCVDFAIEHLPTGKTLDLCLFGGEPLLRFDLVRETTAYALGRSKELSVPARVSITTNGTLVTSEILDFAAEHGVHVCFSIDGPAEVHDLNRTYAGGRGSFADAMHRLYIALQRLPIVQVNAVFGPDTLMALRRSLAYLVDEGARVIHLNPNILSNWPVGIGSRIANVFLEIADYYIDCYDKGREIAINLLDSKMLLFIQGGYAPDDVCAMGDGEWGFAPGGNIYPCERFIGEDVDSPFCLGNIHTGIDLARRCAISRRRGNHNPECEACGLKKYCMNWCGCTNYFMSGRTDMVGPMLCVMEQAAIRAARHAFNALVQSDNELFVNHMYNYANSDFHHR